MSQIGTSVFAFVGYERKSDRLDFHEVSVWGIKSTLEAAFKAGVEAGGNPPKDD